MMPDKLKLAAVVVASLGMLIFIAAATAHNLATVPRLDRSPSVFEQRATVRAALASEE